jgi:hypothetical protein
MDLELRDYSLIASSLVFAVATLMLIYVYGRHASLYAIATLAIWLLAVGNLYASSSYLWAGDVSEGVLDVTRLVMVGVRTLTLILLLALLDYIRKVVSREKQGAS